MIADEGEHFDISQLPDPLADENLLRHSGRGILLMQAFMDEFQIRPRQPQGHRSKIGEAPGESRLMARSGFGFSAQQLYSKKEDA